jgi:hypothetical protein
MDIFDSLKRIKEFLVKPIDEQIFFDPNNTPYVSVTFLYLIDGVFKEISYGTFINIRRIKKPTIKPLPSSYSQEMCVGLNKVLLASYLESSSKSTDDPDPIISDDGYCDGFWLNQDTRVIISVIASPQDVLHCFTITKNQLEIIFLPT